MIKFIKKIKENNSKTIRTGIKYLNDTLGGWDKGKTYLTISMGSSRLFLLNSLIWAMKYNNFNKIRKKEKTPVVLYLTNKDTKEEVHNDLLNYAGGQDLVNDYREGKVSGEESLFRFRMATINDEVEEQRVLINVSRIGSNTKKIEEEILFNISEIESYGDKEVVMVSINELKNYTNKMDIIKSLQSLNRAAKYSNIPIVANIQSNLDIFRKLERESYEQNIVDLSYEYGAIYELVEAIILTKISTLLPNRILSTSSEEIMKDVLTLKIISSKKKSNTQYLNLLYEHSFVSGSQVRLKEDIFEEHTETIEL